MTIRYTCVKCGTVLKIQEDRVGKEKHCPKCKTSFIVPPPGAEESTADAVDVEQPAPAVAKPAVEKVAAAKASSPAVTAPAGDADAADADFDPVAFLMTEGGGAPDKGTAKRAVAAASEQADMKAARSGPAVYAASDEPDVRVGGPRKPSAKSDEDSETELRNRKPKRPAVASAAQTADEMLRVNASTNAKELLTKTMEESRIRAAQMPEDRRAPGIDYKATARELLLRFAPAVGGAVLLIVGAYFLSNLMVGGGPALPALADVSGTVTKDGKPLAEAYVSFTPVDVQAGAGTAYTDENGYYELKYTEGVSGAVIGKNRVEVSKLGPDGREMVPAKTMYGQGSNVIQVVEEGSQTVDIPIP